MYLFVRWDNLRFKPDQSPTFWSVWTYRTLAQSETVKLKIELISHITRSIQFGFVARNPVLHCACGTREQRKNHFLASSVCNQWILITFSWDSNWICVFGLLFISFSVLVWCVSVRVWKIFFSCILTLTFLIRGAQSKPCCTAV